MKEISGSDNKTVGTLATPPAVIGIASEPEEQPMLVSVTPTHKQKYWMQTSASLVRKATPSKKGKEEEVDEEVYSKGPSQEEEEEEELINKSVTVQSANSHLGCTNAGLTESVIWN